MMEEEFETQSDQILKPKRIKAWVSRYTSMVKQDRFTKAVARIRSVLHDEIDGASIRDGGDGEGDVLSDEEEGGGVEEEEEEEDCGVHQHLVRLQATSTRNISGWWQIQKWLASAFSTAGATAQDGYRVSSQEEPRARLRGSGSTLSTVPTMGLFLQYSSICRSTG
jgi:hypothetical protein